MIHIVKYFYILVHFVALGCDFNSWHPNISMHILHTVLHTFHNRLTSLQTLLEIKRIVFNNQELPELVIISLMLRTSMFDSRAILWGEIKCWSLLQVNPLHPDTSVHFLYTLLFTFTLVLTRRIHLTITASEVGDLFLYSHDLNVQFSSIILRRI